MGDLRRLRVTHDGAGWASDWQLAQVTVTSLETGEGWTFPCGNAWIKDQGWHVVEVKTQNLFYGSLTEPLKP
eukprot:9466163-Pyramimonas_sp.AAC.1